jgi:dihydrofolate synthase/folylpolyglutamate synthase
VAVKLLDLLPEALRPTRQSVQEGVAATRWPGRLQREVVDGVTWLFDVAHNAAGVESLLAALPHLAPRRPLVALVGVLGDKDWDRMLRPLFGTVDRAILAEPPSAPADRRWDPDRVLSTLGAPDHVRAVRPFAAAVDAASKEARDGMVVCTGSVHTVGDAMTTLGIAPFPDDAGLPPGGGGS